MKTIHYEYIDTPVEKETLHIKGKNLKAIVNIMTGINNDIWVYICPSLNVSGYGNTKEDAEASFDHNMEVLMKDLFSASLSQRAKYIKQLGWNQEQFFAKHYSKAFVDKDGVLKNLQTPKLVSLEATV